MMRLFVVLLLAALVITVFSTDSLTSEEFEDAFSTKRHAMDSEGPLELEDQAELEVGDYEQGDFDDGDKASQDVDNSKQATEEAELEEDGNVFVNDGMRSPQSTARRRRRYRFRYSKSG